uniref:RAP domain-containing protein n=1 Tax=Araucaria cunninghamii TaxID=56994 RepID=A0A0D6R1E5_ARACU
MEALPLHCAGTFKHLQGTNNAFYQRSSLPFGGRKGWGNNAILMKTRMTRVEIDVHVGKEEVGSIWERELLEEIDPLGFQAPWRRSKHRNYLVEQKDDEDDDNEDTGDWSKRARTSALKAIRARGFKVISVQKLLPRKKKKKVQKKKSSSENNNRVKLNDSTQSPMNINDLGGEEEEDDDDDVDDRVRLELDLREKLGGLWGVSNRKKEVALNKALVEASSAEDVLAQVTEVIGAVSKGLRPSPLSPLNMATGLHRIAKNMEAVCASKSERLAFARQRDMAVLVSVAMASLPDCTAQGIANIAWALSKIGGESLYSSEMDRIAQVALAKMSEFNTQNVANLAGAFAAMRHAAPQLFTELAKRASSMAGAFRCQELAQFLWSFAALYHPAHTLMDSLDFLLHKNEGNARASDQDDKNGMGESDYCMGRLFNNFTRDQLANVAWSYTVLNEMGRPFFSYIWGSLVEFECQRISAEYREDVMYAWQLHQANQCLKVEYPHLGQSLGTELETRVAQACKTKRFNNKTTSSFQKEVGRLLVSTGFDWEQEYCVDGYTLDAVIRTRKVALEIDGPSHFSRNTGSALGHTMLKRRYLASVGWHVVSLNWQRWEELFGESEQMEHLRTLLKDVL